VMLCDTLIRHKELRAGYILRGRICRSDASSVYSNSQSGCAPTFMTSARSAR
jgi:hypothetical protein